MRPHPLPQRSPARRRGLGRSATSHITIVLLVGACIFCCIWSLFLSVVDWKDWKGDGGGLVSSRRSGDWAASKQRASRAELGRSTKAPDLRARPDKQSSWKTQLGLLFSEGGESSSKEAAQMNPKLQPIGLVCMGWRETTGCSPDNPLYRDGNRSCIARIPRNKAGYCELQDRRKSMRNAVQGDPPIRAMKISCTSQPPLWMLRSGIRCKDAWEFVVFAERSLAFRAPGSLQLASHSPSIAAEGVAGSPSRGIVMCVSDGTILSAYVSIRVLRDAGCSLPVELWHMPDELSKSTRIVASLVANYGAALRPALVSREELCHTGSDKCFNIKIHALFYAG